MSRAERVARVKAALVQSIDAAKANGAVIICDIDRAWRDDGVFGCCALASLDVVAIPGLRVPFAADGDEMAREWDSIELGFDDAPWSSSLTQDGSPALTDFWLLGRELRAQYQPVKVGDFLVAQEEATVAARMRFT